MPIRRNGYYNDPAIGEAFNNLAQLFGPPKGADAAGWANAAATRADMARKQAVFDAYRSMGVSSPEAAALAIGAGVYTPAQSFQAIDMNNRAAMERQNAVNQTDLQKAEIAARAALEQQYAKPVIVSEGQVAYLPQPTQAATGLAQILQGNVTVKPGEVTTAPTGQVYQGREVPLTKDQWLAREAAGLRGSGVLDDATMQAIIFGNTPLETVRTPEGPRLVPRTQAIGQEPILAEGQQPRVQTANYRTPDGREGTARFDPNTGAWFDTQTGDRLPPQTVTFGTSVQGARSEALGTSTASMAQRTIIELDSAKDVALRLREIVATSPTSQGIIGRLRGTAQNFAEVANELGQFFGGGPQEVAQTINEAMRQHGLTQFFDPSIPKIELLKNMLAFKYAKALQPDRLSNEMLNQARAALGLDRWTSNQKDTLTRLDEALKVIEMEQGRYRTALSQGVGQPGPTAVPQQGAVRRRFNPATGRIE